MPNVRSGEEMSGDHDDGVPIMSDKREKAIRERAYALWEKSGSKHGQHGEHWDQAVREVDAEAGADKPKAGSKATPTARAKPGPKPKALATPAVVPAIKAKPGPKPKAAAAAPVESPKPAVAAKPAAVAKPVAATKAKPAAKPEPVSAPAKAVSKAKQAAESVVATVKRAAKGTAKK